MILFIPCMQMKTKSWECSLVDDSLGSNVKELLKKAESWENEYTKSLPKSGEITMCEKCVQVWLLGVRTSASICLNLFPLATIVIIGF